jgi:hypothetical protein
MVLSPAWTTFMVPRRRAIEAYRVTLLLPKCPPTAPAYSDASGYDGFPIFGLTFASPGTMRPASVSGACRPIIGGFIRVLWPWPRMDELMFFEGLFIATILSGY